MAFDRHDSRLTRLPTLGSGTAGGSLELPAPASRRLRGFHRFHMGHFAADASRALTPANTSPAAKRPRVRRPTTAHQP